MEIHRVYQARFAKEVCHKMVARSIATLRKRGFAGFQTVRALQESNCRDVSDEDGVYLVLRKARTPPVFLERSVGGRFKRKDPTVRVQVLQEKWVEGAFVLNIGKAGPGKKANRRYRLQKYMKFGNGEPVGHWGGRYIWQLTDSTDLMICWKATPGAVPREVEKELIKEFEQTFCCLPFANCNR
jgi:hypothetical protein